MQNHKTNTLNASSKPFFPTNTNNHPSSDSTPKSDKKNNKLHTGKENNLYLKNFPKTQQTTANNDNIVTNNFSYLDVLQSKVTLEPKKTIRIIAGETNTTTENNQKRCNEVNENNATTGDIKKKKKKKKKKNTEENKPSLFPNKQPLILGDYIGKELTKQLQEKKEEKHEEQNKTLQKKNNKDNVVLKKNRITKAIQAKGNTKGMKPIRLEINSSNLKEITNQDIYNAFMEAITLKKKTDLKHDQQIDNKKKLENNKLNEEGNNEGTVKFATRRKKKPNKLKRIILKEKEIRKLNQIAPNQIVDIRNWKENNKEEEKQEEDDTLHEFLIEIEENDDIKKEDKTINEKEFTYRQESDMSESDNETERKETVICDNTEINTNIINESQPTNKNKQSTQMKIREYVYYPLNPTLDNLIETLLTKLHTYQKRLKKNEQKKFKSKRRYVVGIRETLKGLKLKQVRAVIIAPNIQKITTPGGLDECVAKIITQAKEQGLPIFFALNRKKIAKALEKINKISVVALYSMDGAFEEFKKAKELVEILQSIDNEEEKTSLDV
ncbi:hypothetical protein ABK040_015115 [Willaertia magna]